MRIPDGLSWMLGRSETAAWLDALPSLVDQAAERWGLEIGEPFAASSVSWVAPARRHGADLVVKIQWPHPECEHEAAALRAWDGDGAARLLGHDADRHALLIERCAPGERLADADRGDVDAIGVMVDLLPRLWRPASLPFGTLADEAASWRATLWEQWSAAGEPCERRLVEAADEALRDLPGSQGEAVLLHQDLHGDNVLDSERGWLAIDPKPLVGERELAVAPIVRDFALGTERAETIRRLDRLTAELGLDRERARGWTVGQTIAWAFSSGHAAHHYDTARWLLDG